MGREMKTESTSHDAELHLVRGRRFDQPTPGPRVEVLMSRDFVSLPPWFSAAQAAKVMRQTGKSHAVFGGQRLATVAELEAGGPKSADRSAASCAAPFGPTITVDASLNEAWAVMEANHLDRVAVVLGRVLVGVVTRDALAAERPATRPFQMAA